MPIDREIEDVVVEGFDDEPVTYKIKKFNKQGPSEIIETGLTLAEARDYCNNPETKGDDWFCGYERE